MKLPYLRSCCVRISCLCKADGQHAAAKEIRSYQDARADAIPMLTVSNIRADGGSGMWYVQ